MPALPHGDPAPSDGGLPAGLDWGRPLRAYVHVPFCAARCGYCDFNTYTAAELGGFGTQAYLRAIGEEIDLAATVCKPQPLASIFIGGGTPSLLEPAILAAMLSHLASAFGLQAGAEVTMEAMSTAAATPAQSARFCIPAATRGGSTRGSSRPAARPVATAANTIATSTRSQAVRRVAPSGAQPPALTNQAVSAPSSEAGPVVWRPNASMRQGGVPSLTMPATSSAAPIAWLSTAAGGVRMRSPFSAHTNGAAMKTATTAIGRPRRNRLAMLTAFLTPHHAGR